MKDKIKRILFNILIVFIIVFLIMVLNIVMFCIYNIDHFRSGTDSLSVLKVIFELSLRYSLNQLVISVPLLFILGFFNKISNTLKVVITISIVIITFIIYHLFL